MMWMHVRLFNHPPIEYLGCYILWQLKIKLLWTFVCRFLYEHKFLFLWGKWPRVQFLKNVLWNTSAFNFKSTYQLSMDCTFDAVCKNSRSWVPRVMKIFSYIFFYQFYSCSSYISLDYLFWVDISPNSFILQVDIQLSWHHLLKRLSCNWISLTPLWKISWS